MLQLLMKMKKIVLVLPLLASVLSIQLKALKAAARSRDKVFRFG